MVVMWVPLTTGWNADVCPERAATPAHGKEANRKTNKSLRSPPPPPSQPTRACHSLQVG
jgi:hypothetical protein